MTSDEHGGNAGLTRRHALIAIGSTAATAALAQATAPLEARLTDASGRLVTITAGTRAFDLSALDFAEDAAARFVIRREPGILSIVLLRGALHRRARCEEWSLSFTDPKAPPGDERPRARDANVLFSCVIAGQRLSLAPPDGRKAWDWLPAAASEPAPVPPLPGPPLTLAAPLGRNSVQALLGRLFGERIATSDVPRARGDTLGSGYRMEISWRTPQRQAAGAGFPTVWQLSGTGTAGFALWRSGLALRRLRFGRRLDATLQADTLAKLFPSPPRSQLEVGLYAHADALEGRGELPTEAVPQSAVQAGVISIPSLPGAMLGLRTVDDERRAVSAVLGEMSLLLGTPGRNEEGPIKAETGLVQRGIGLDRNAPEVLATSVLLHPPEKAWAMRTRHGLLGVAGPEKADARWREDVAPVSLLLHETQGSRIPRQFAAELRLVSAGIPLRRTQAETAPQSVPWSRLDFDGTRCGFSLGSLPAAGTVTNYPCFVALGRRGRGDFDPAPITFSLDGATLRATRPRDLLDLVWRFQGMVLEADQGVARLLPDRRMATARGATTPAAPDSRPLIAVDFPPQHLVERAHYRRRSLPALPEPALPASELATLLPDLLAESADRRRQARQAIQDRMKAALTGEAAALFQRLCEKFSAAAESRNLAPELRVYIGRYAADPEAAPILAELAPGLVTPLDRLNELPEKDGDTHVKELFEQFKAFYASAPRPTELPALPNEYEGREAFQTWLEQQPPDQRSGLAERMLGLVAAFERNLDEQAEPFKDIAQARSAGASRLVFRLDARRASARPGEPAGSMPFSLDALTDWGRMDLAVVRRAETLFLRDDGPGLRIRQDDVAAILRFQGLTETLPSRGTSSHRVRWDERLREVAASARAAPGQFETAIELPARLFLSTAQDALWQTPRRLPVFAEADAPLWRATLLPDGLQQDLRAVWSPDFSPDFLQGSVGAMSPAEGTEAPWPALPGQAPQPFRMALDGRDRHQLVAMSSLHGLVALARVVNGSLDRTSQDPEPDSFKVDGLKPGADPKQIVAALHRPRAIRAGRLSLSALGATAYLDAGFVPPIAARVLDGPNPAFAFSLEAWSQRTVLGRDTEVEVLYRGYLMPLGIRCVLSKRTERVFVRRRDRSPAAYLIQRKFLRIVEPKKAYPAPFQPHEGRRWCPRLVQMLLTQSPDLVDYEADAATVAGSGIDVGPHGRIRLPSLEAGGGFVFWPRTAARQGSEVSFACRVVSHGDAAATTSVPLIFVSQEVAARRDVMEDLAGYYNGLDANDRRRVMDMHGAALCYAPEDRPGENTHVTQRWLLGVEGRPDPTREPFDPSSGDPNTTRYEFDPELLGVDQPPFYPVVQAAEVQFDKVQRLTGQDAQAIRVRWNRPYVEHGFQYTAAGERRSGATDRAASADVYLRVDMPKGSEGAPRLQFSGGTQAAGDRGGGIGQPAIDISGVSRTNGVIAGGEPMEGGVNYKAAFDPKAFFPADAKLLGLFPLKDVLRALTAATEGKDAAPQLAETVLYGAADEVGNVAVFLRERVLEPLDALLARLELEYRQRQGGDELQAALGRGFPGMEATWRRLRAALAAAIAASGQGIVAMADPLAEVHAAGKRLILLIEEVARNPASLVAGLAELLGRLTRDSIVSSALEAWQQQQDQLKQMLKGIGDRALGQVLALGRAADAITDDVERQAQEAIRDQLTKLMPELDAVLRQAHCAMDQEDAGACLAKALAARLRAELERDAAAAAAPHIAAALAMLRRAEADAEAAVGPLMPYVLLAVRLVRQERPSPGEIQQQVRAIANRFAGGLLTQAEQSVAAAAGDICRGTLEPFRQLLVALLPGAHPNACGTPAGLSDAVKSAATWLERLADQGEAFRPAANSLRVALVDALNGLDDAFCGIGEARAEVIMALNRFLPDCTVPASFEVRLVPLFELRALQARAKTLLTELSEIAGALDARLEGSTTSAVSAILGAIAPLPPELADPLRQELHDHVLRVVREVYGVAAEVTLAGAALAGQIPPRPPAAVLRDARIIARLGGDAAAALLQMRQEPEAALQRLAGSPNVTLAEAREAALRLLDDAAPAARAAALRALEGSGIPSVLRLAARARVVAAEIEKLGSQTYPGVTDVIAAGRAVAAAMGMGSNATDEALRRLEETSIRLLRETIAAAVVTSGDVVLRLRPVLAPMLRVAEAANRWAVQLRDEIDQRLGQDELSRKIRSEIRVVRLDNGTTRDALTADRDAFALAGRQGPGELADADWLTAFQRLRGLADKGQLGLQLLVQKISNIEQDTRRAAAAALARLIDLDALRRELDERLRDLIPSRIKLDYAFAHDLQAQSFGPITFQTFRGRGDDGMPAGSEPGRLTLATVVETDLIKLAQGKPAAEAVRTKLSGRIDPFDIDLAGFATFSFDGLRFDSDGGSSDFKVLFRTVSPGEKMQYVESLKSIFGDDGGGAFVQAFPGGRGVRAGYGLNIPVASLGAASFLNISVNAALSLPFGAQDARFIAGLGREGNAFVISIPPYGGGGFLEIEGGASGGTPRITALRLAFQFGFAGGFSFGPLRGYGMAMAGLFIQLGNGTRIEGYFVASGAASIACFSLSAVLTVRVYDSGGGISGEASFTFTFRMGLIRVGYSVRVRPNVPGPSRGSGGAGNRHAPPARTLFAGPGAPPAPSPPAETRHRAITVAAGPGLGWAEDRRRFTRRVREDRPP